jgi:putative Mn2+ efflux pump MntP
MKNMLEEYLPFLGLLIFGNIENLILASQGEVKKANVLSLSIMSIIIVVLWFIIGTVLTEQAIRYSNIIDFIGGLVIFILGIQSIVEVYKNKKSNKSE